MLNNGAIIDLLDAQFAKSIDDQRLHAHSPASDSIVIIIIANINALIGTDAGSIKGYFKNSGIRFFTIYFRRNNNMIKIIDKLGAV